MRRIRPPRNPFARWTTGRLEREYRELTELLIRPEPRRVDGNWRAGARDRASRSAGIGRRVQIGTELTRRGVDVAAIEAEVRAGGTDE